jgi:hypothetical protein
MISGSIAARASLLGSGGRDMMFVRELSGRN